MDSEQYLALSKLAYVDLSSFAINTQLDIIIGNANVVLEYDLSILSSVAASWKLVNYEENTISGFAGFALKNSSTGQVIATFRGSEFGGDESLTTKLQDIYSDLQLALPGAPTSEPNQFRDVYSGYNLVRVA